MILQGFILKLQERKENDLSLIFFSKEKGKVEILVKGARKPLSKLRGLCQFFVFSKLSLVKGKKNFHLIGGEEIKIFKNIFKSFKKLKEAYFILKILDNFFPFFPPSADPPKLYAKAEKKEPKIFVLTLKTLEKIDIFKKEKSKTIALSFLIKFLTFSGFRPEINKCLICHKLLQNDFAFFDFKQGGIICPACQKNKDVDQIKISLGTLKILQSLLYKDFDFLKEKDFSEENLVEIEDLLEKFLAWRQ